MYSRDSGAQIAEFQESQMSLRFMKWDLFLKWGLFVILNNVSLSQIRAETNDRALAERELASEKAPLDKSNRMEEILVWKLSEELKLNGRDEKKVSELIRQLNEEKSQRATEIEALQIQMSAELSASEAKNLLRNYQRALKAYNQISVDEIQRVQKILDPQKSMRYFAVKGGLSQRIRAILGYNSRSDKHPKADIENPEKIEKLPDPKIIEDP
jgi:vacuolar-type H+-ATPase subunit I/STV1